ncbi:cuticle protein 3-like [Anoplophora glabripennis]|uniref:cuticle protein 3-like n=1 Tax=Anoplophora glabripennis TaxID=217634 RepID=UPI0008742F56|nr:cuticle protein 3-like [Anoplophora glabripennis]
MKQILFLTLFGFAACGVYSPPRRYPSNTSPTSQYVAPASQSQYYGSSYQQVPILRLDSSNSGDGTYTYAYETGDGISGQEQGDARGEGTRAQGGFSYTSPNGQPIQLQYTADENGFIPQGSHLPAGLTGPILRSIEQNLADERRGVVDDGQYRAGPSQSYGQQQNVATQQYNTPTKYTPQKYNTAQQYRPAQYAQNKYGAPTRPQTGYKF